MDDKDGDGLGEDDELGSVVAQKILDPGGKFQSLLMGALPPAYFSKKNEVKKPLAPIGPLLTSFGFEVAAASVAFAVMYWYFATLPTPRTTISKTLLPGQVCSALNPKRGTTYYSKEHSENAQFASIDLSQQECIELLSRHDVCSDGIRYDHLTLWGVTNPNNSQYYPGGKGYFSFTPTQTQGLTSKLAPFFGKSVSFPKPDISVVFTGSNTNWYLFNFANGISSDAFTSHPGVDASSLLFDAVSNKVYDPDRFKTRKDYDLSSSTPITAVDKIGGKVLESALGKFDYESLAVNDGKFFGIRTGPWLVGNWGIAVDNVGNVYVADSGNSLVRMIGANGLVTNLGATASPPINSPLGIAVDNLGNVFVADTGNNMIRKIDVSTDLVTNLGATASPPINSPIGIALDNLGNVIVADTGNNMIREIDVSTDLVTNLGTSAGLSDPKGVTVDGIGNLYVTNGGNEVYKISTSGVVTEIGTSASPRFWIPVGVAVDTADNVYVVEEGNHLVRKIDTSGVVTHLGTSASPKSFSYPRGVAVDSNGNVYVADSNNFLVRKIDASSLGTVTRFVGRAVVFTWDMRSPADPTTIELWPTSVLDSKPLIDSAGSGFHGAKCLKVETGFSQGFCYIVVHAEYNQEAGLLFVELTEYYRDGGQYYGYSHIIAFDPSSKTSYPPIWYVYYESSSRHIWGVFQTPERGTVLYMTSGAISSIPNQNSNPITLDAHQYNSLVAGTSVLDASKIPGQDGPPRFLLMLLEDQGFNKMVTYDTFNDTYFSTQPDNAAATTHYMLAYSWGVCADNVTRNLVELTFSNDYSNECQLPKTGLYYQSKNQYFVIPFNCLGIAHDKLLTHCPEIKANMKALADATCADSITKVCRQQYDLNPPFSCVENTYPLPLTVLSLAFSNTNALASALAIIVSALLSRVYKNYRPTEAELQVANPVQKEDEDNDDVESAFQKMTNCGKKRNRVAP